MEIMKSLLGLFKLNSQPYKCTCNKTRSNEYCDSMYTLLEFTKSSKNFDPVKAKKIYQVIIKYK